MKKKSICLNCLKEFEYHVHPKNAGKYCSRKCLYVKDADRLRQFNKDRFNWETASEDEKLEKLKQNYEKNIIRKEGCWDWSGAKDKNGYGQLNKDKQKQIKAHRAAWIIYNGPIPIKLCVLHKCDNPICSNPEHLYLGTPMDNAKDKVSRNRQAKGAKHSMSLFGKKMSPEFCEKTRIRRLGTKLIEGRYIKVT